MPTTSINIHCAKDARVEHFNPDNNMALTIKAGGASVTYFGLPAEIAWSMFDLMRDGETSFHYKDKDVYELGRDPQGAADLIRRARAETLPVAVEEVAQ